MEQKYKKYKWSAKIIFKPLNLAEQKNSQVFPT